MTENNEYPRVKEIAHELGVTLAEEMHKNPNNFEVIVKNLPYACMKIEEFERWMGLDGGFYNPDVVRGFATVIAKQGFPKLAERTYERMTLPIPKEVAREIGREYIVSAPREAWRFYQTWGLDRKHFGYDCVVVGMSYSERFEKIFGEVPPDVRELLEQEGKNIAQHGKYLIE